MSSAVTTKILEESEWKLLQAADAKLEEEQDGDEVILICPRCAGDGKDPDGDRGCPSCQGTGIGRHGDPSTSSCSCYGGRLSKYDPPCETCDGAGYIYAELNRSNVDRLRAEGYVLDKEPPRAYGSANDDPDEGPW